MSQADTHRCILMARLTDSLTLLAQVVVLNYKRGRRRRNISIVAGVKKNKKTF